MVAIEDFGMVDFDSGNRLIFLISQPRAGSTLIQRILGAHPEILTESEPWLMLHGVYGLKQTGHAAEYNAGLAFQGTQHFLDSNCEGRKTYLESLRMMYAHLYCFALAGNKERLFLDKTPRYYFIIPEIAEIFPSARFIILLRNPLAVASSIFQTWGVGRPGGLSEYRCDLVLAPTLLLEGIRLLGNRAFVLRYEEFLSAPIERMTSICNFLGVDFDEEMLLFNREQDRKKWPMGDQGKIYSENQIVTENAKAWMEHAADAQIFRILMDYIKLIGADLLDDLGYAYNECYGAINNQKPRKYKMINTISLNRLLG